MEKDSSITIAGTIPRSLYWKIKNSQGDLTLSRRMRILFEKGFKLEEKENEKKKEKK